MVITGNILKLRTYILTMILLLPVMLAQGQDDQEIISGKVSYKSSKNIYVSFRSTEGISIGDTLFLGAKERVPALVVKNKSSISCMCEAIGNSDFTLEQELIFILPRISTGQESPQPAIISEPGNEVEADSLPPADTLSVATKTTKEGGAVHGRVSISSYSDFSSIDAGNHQRMRYVIALGAKEIAGSKLSFNSYISFRHGDDNWDEIKDNFYNGLKIYDLSFHYKFNEGMDLWFGRKINPKLSSLGAIDGIQYEHTFGAFSAGVIFGSRPDWEDYSFDASLFQAGAYLNHRYKSSKMQFESTVAFVDQENDWNTDRRFLYLQHLNRLMGKVFFFGSAEIDLYKYIDDKKETTFKLTNLYLSVRYRIIRELTFSVSYSARNNIILYETYKSYIDRLLELETLQGYIVGVMSRPVKNLSVGVRASYRYRPEDASPSRSMQANVNITRSKYLPVTLSFIATFLETSYIQGREYGIRASRDVAKGLYAAMGYRNTSYDFQSGEPSSDQNCLDLNLSYRAPWQIYVSANYEAILDKNYSLNRLYINLSKRF